MNRLTRTALSATLLAFAACGGEPAGPEAGVRAWVETMHRAAEEKDRGTLVDGISPAYADGRGLTRDDIGDRLRLLFLRRDPIAVIPSIDEIRILDDTIAEVTLTVAMAGTSNSILGISADAYRFELELEADGDDWQLIAARWGELGRELR